MLRRALFTIQRQTVATKFFIASQRGFALTKYRFDDEDFEPNRFQKSASTHLTNAEELIN